MSSSEFVSGVLWSSKSGGEEDHTLLENLSQDKSAVLISSVEEDHTLVFSQKCLSLNNSVPPSPTQTLMDNSSGDASAVLVSSAPPSPAHERDHTLVLSLNNSVSPSSVYHTLMENSSGDGSAVLVSPSPAHEEYHTLPENVPLPEHQSWDYREQVSPIPPSLDLTLVLSPSPDMETPPVLSSPGHQRDGLALVPTEAVFGRPRPTHSQSLSDPPDPSKSVKDTLLASSKGNPLGVCSTDCAKTLLASSKVCTDGTGLISPSDADSSPQLVAGLADPSPICIESSSSPELVGVEVQRSNFSLGAEVQRSSSSPELVVGAEVQRSSSSPELVVGAEVQRSSSSPELVGAEVQRSSSSPELVAAERSEIGGETRLLVVKIHEVPGSSSESTKPQDALVATSADWDKRDSEEYDADVDIEMDWSRSQLLAPSQSPAAWKEGLFVTPAAGGGAMLLSDNNITPTPKYHQMCTPQLKSQCTRFGVKVLPKRKMIAKLQEIYSYTHPLVGK
jgi:hypothetical protein